MKKVLTIVLVVFISSAVVSCRSSKKPNAKLDEKTKKYWKWNSATGGEW